MKLGKEEETGEKTKKKALAIVGIGPVGLMAVFAAKQLAKKNKNILVFAIDSIPARLELASKFGAIPIHREEVDPVHAVHDMTDGRGCDFIVEAVGFPSALRLACDIASFGAVISSCGCHSEAAVSLSTLYNKNLTLKSGRCSARHYMNILKKIKFNIHKNSAYFVI
jgi:threonine dehydrogenase-like Zn-dependent dehydrogenase